MSNQATALMHPPITMSSIPLKELLAEELRDLLHAEGQLVAALPKMVEAAHNPNSKNEDNSGEWLFFELAIRGSEAITLPRPDTLKQF